MKTINFIVFIAFFLSFISCKRFLFLGNDETSSIEVGNAARVILHARGPVNIAITDRDPDVRGVFQESSSWVYDYFKNSGGDPGAIRRIRTVKCPEGRVQFHIYTYDGSSLVKLYFFDSQEMSGCNYSFAEISEEIVTVSLKGCDFMPRDPLSEDILSDILTNSYCEGAISPVSGASLEVDLEMVFTKESEFCIPSNSYPDVDCMLEIPYSSSATKSCNCNHSGTGYIYGSCILHDCQSGYRVSGQSCVPETTFLPGQIRVDEDNPSFFIYHGGGPAFLCGPGAESEWFLYYGSRNPDGTRSDGGQMQMIDRLGRTGANALYMMAISLCCGDRNPFVDSDPANGIDMDILDQWDTWFTEMDNKGVVANFYFYDSDVKISESISNGGLGWPLVNGELHPQEKNFIETIVNRFEHHTHLVWQVYDEIDGMGTDYIQHGKKIAEAIRNADDHNHPIGVHDSFYNGFSPFADDTNIDYYAIKLDNKSSMELNSRLFEAWTEAAGRYNIMLAESDDFGSGSEALDKIWASATAGAYVFPEEWELCCISDSELAMCGNVVQFMESTPFNSMTPRNDLAYYGTKWVLANPSAGNFILFGRIDNGYNGVGIKDLPEGTYTRRWMDPVTGESFTEAAKYFAASSYKNFSPPAGLTVLNYRVVLYLMKITQ